MTIITMKVSNMGFVGVDCDQDRIIIFGMPTVPIKCVKDGHTCEADGSFLNFDLYCALGQMCTCQAKNDIAKNTFEIAPYLYPFTIEFNILIGKCAMELDHYFHH